MKKKVFAIFIAIILIIILTILVINLKFSEQSNSMQKNEKNNENNLENSNSLYNPKVYEATNEDVEKIKKEINATANTDIYRIEEEPGGRKILQVKPEVQFNVDLAGIIKNDKPEEYELESLLEKMPNNTGVWISSQSRDYFLKLLKNNGIENFKITSDGYLKSNLTVENEISNKLENMIKSDKLYIVNITGKAYERDYITGEIVEYPFEDMDPTQIVELYGNNNKVIIEVTTNKKSKLTDKEILETIVQY